VAGNFGEEIPLSSPFCKGGKIKGDLKNPSPKNSSPYRGEDKKEWKI